ncbi:hypothetical protein EKI60_01180 [Candidatus Saccharibacteria bacterium]|nr:MAG: hypothetical protein EKI60_01180 [Candidatus Saccharibacteria bacterium]TXG76087.1 MAG: hypothetical protein E6P97_04245 [Patescibacteria group bacterium]
MHKDHPQEHQVIVNGEHSPVEVAKFILIISAILGASLALTNKYGPINFEGWSRWFMGVFFVVFASFKFVGYKMFSMMFAGYDVIAKRSMLYAHLYPFIELALGLAYLLNIAPVARDVSALIIMSVSTIGVYQEIKKRSGIHCACLGNVIKLPLSTVSLVEDVSMGLMALIMLAKR